AMAVKKNDEVLYGKYTGTEVELDGKKYFILREADVLGIIES
ncbi:MAG: co-chaperone GroES, partial [Sedimentisphaerales bacterium]|nr:co-chaperone GroES [Sedimentisphaerales bacterium]